MSDELKPCPFCGREQHLCPEEIPYTGQLHECGSCNVISYDWNIRPIEDALRARIAELEAEIERLTVHSDIERQDDKSPNDTQTQTIVYGKWIPVSERLPEDGEVVWLWDGNNLGMGYYLVLAGQFMDRDTPLRRIKPTHWMPLPSTPEVLKVIGEGEADDISKPKPCPLCGQDPITKISDKTGQTLYTCRRAAICSATWFTLDEWNCLQFYFAHQEGEADAGNL